MSITNPQDWSEVERRAKAHEHEASINQVLSNAGLNLIHITAEDRMRGGIISAIQEIESGHKHLAISTLKNCLKL